MNAIPDKYLIDKQEPGNYYLIDIDDNSDDFIYKLMEFVVAGQKKLMHKRWSKGLPWCYTNEKGENVIDYGNKKEYF